MFDPVEAAAERIRAYGGGGSVVGKLMRLLKAAPEEEAVVARSAEPVADTYTATGRAIPRDDEYERLQSLVTNQPTEAGNYQWAVVKPNGDVHGAPFDFKGSALRVANSLNQATPGHTVQALSVDAPEISRFVPQAPDLNANPLKKATPQEIDQLLTNSPQMAEGGEVDDNSLSKISAFLKRYGGPHAQRLGVGIAKQFYGLDAQGNPTLGGQAWTSSQHGTPPAILDQFASIPASLIPIANAINPESRMPADIQAMDRASGTSGIPTPQWSLDAAARLAQLERRVAATTGVSPAQTLPEHLEDAAAMLATPLPAAKVAKEAPALQRALEMLTPVRPPTIARYAGDTAVLGSSTAALDALAKRLTAAKPASADPVDPAIEQAALAQTNGPQGFAQGGSVKAKPRVRPIQDLPRDKNGLFIQPDTLTDEIAVWVEHNRMRASKKAFYADTYCGDPKTLDQKADYNCGGCNQRDGDICLLVSDDSKEKNAQGDYPPLKVNLRKGSCGLWEVVDPDDPEQLSNRIPASVANYGVRKGGGPEDAFGCHECWKAIKNKWPTLLGRDAWCGDWGTTIQRGKACCTTNGAPTI